MSITFTLNNGSTLTLGKESKNIRVVIHDDTKAETPTTMVTDYTAKLFAEAGFTRKPTFDEYKAMPRAVCQSDILIRTEFCCVGELVEKAWQAMKMHRPA